MGNTRFPRKFSPKGRISLMRSLNKSVSPLSGMYPETYFAGANTAHGFVSAYPDMIREGDFSRVYILKGGSGTGKSSFMKRCASAAEEAGGKVTLLLCSSDPTSADAVILTGKDGGCTAILDGTAPHMTDPILPGAVGEIVNLGQFWQTDVLVHSRAEIAYYTEQKRAAYQRAYRYLAAYGEITAAARTLLAECILQEKMHAAAERLLASLPRGEQYTAQIRYTCAVSMKGLFRLGTFSAIANKTHILADPYGCAPLFLQEMCRVACGRRCSLLYAPGIGETDTPCELFFPRAGIAVRTVSDDEQTDGVNMQRFVDRRALAARRMRLRFAERCRASLMDGALEALTEADAAHFALEEIYKSAMDFSGVRGIGEEIAAQIVQSI